MKSKGFAPEYSTFFIRTVAFLIDGMILLLPFYLCGYLAKTMIGIPDYIDMSRPGSYSSEIQTVVLLKKILQFIIGWLYSAVLYSSSYEGTLGMNICNIRVTDSEGNRISFTVGTIRYFIMPISFLVFGLGIFMIFGNEKRQALHDKISGTLVVDKN